MPGLSLEGVPNPPPLNLFDWSSRSNNAFSSPTLLAMLIASESWSWAKHWSRRAWHEAEASRCWWGWTCCCWGWWGCWGTWGCWADGRWAVREWCNEVDRWGAGRPDVAGASMTSTPRSLSSTDWTRLGGSISAITTWRGCCLARHGVSDVPASLCLGLTVADVVACVDGTPGGVAMVCRLGLVFGMVDEDVGSTVLVWVQLLTHRGFCCFIGGAVITVREWRILIW